MKRLLLAVSIVTLAFMFSCQSQTPAQPDTKAADEAMLKNLDAEWSKAASAKDVDKTVSYYAADALVLPTNLPALDSKGAIRNIWNEILGAPGFSGGWTATRVEVARSSDIGYVTGTYTFAVNDEDGKPDIDRGKFVEVWKKQGDGSWKCVVDIWNSDLPAKRPRERK